MFNSVLESSTEYSIIATDIHGVILEYNSGSANLFGWTKEEVMGKMLMEKLSVRMVGSRGVIQEISRKVEAEGMTEYELERIRKDGSLFQAHAIVTALKDASGKTLGFLEIARDITEKLALEKELREDQGLPGEHRAELGGCHRDHRPQGPDHFYQPGYGRDGGHVAG